LKIGLRPRADFNGPFLAAEIFDEKKARSLWVASCELDNRLVLLCQIVLLTLLVGAFDRAVLFVGASAARRVGSSSTIGEA